MSNSDEITDGCGGCWAKRCANCGKDTMEVVRPGKVQCSDACEWKCDGGCVKCADDIPCPLCFKRVSGPEPTCISCGVPLSRHLGIQPLCEKLNGMINILERENNTMLFALKRIMQLGNIHEIHDIANSVVVSIQHHD